MNLKEYINDWQNAPSNQGTNEKSLEVLLFRAMMDYYTYHLSGTSAVVRPEETHKHYVYPGAYLRRYCEISDVLFIVFSKQYNNLRMTHLQAKRQADNLAFANSKSFAFGLDQLQYYLLHGRLPFRNRGKSKYPELTLCNPMFSDSISSYGVFYKETTGQYNFAYEIASLVHRYGATGVFDTLGVMHARYMNSLCRLLPYGFNWVEEYAKGDCCVKCGELVSALDIDSFEDELSKCHVGSLVRKGDSVGAAVVAYAAQIFEAHYDAMSAGEKDVVNAFREFNRGNDFNIGDFHLEEDALPGCMVLINADRTKKD